jgi:hypothetical protein
MTLALAAESLKPNMPVFAAPLVCAGRGSTFEGV